MLANKQSNGPRLAISHRSPARTIRPRCMPPQGSAMVLGAPPAMADSALLLEVLLSGPAVNLRSVADVIRNDVGLTVQLLGLVAGQGKGRSTEISASKNVVLAGISGLRRLAAETELLSSHPCGREGVRACEQFWAHARLTGLMAEELAYEAKDIDTEEAYVAGLLFHLAELPSLLGWETGLAHAASFEEGAVRVEQWHLPKLLCDVVRGDDQLCSPASRRLLNLVRVADHHAARLQRLVGEFARGVF